MSVFLFIFWWKFLDNQLVIPHFVFPRCILRFPGSRTTHQIYRASKFLWLMGLPFNTQRFWISRLKGVSSFQAGLMLILHSTLRSLGYFCEFQKPYFRFRIPLVFYSFNEIFIPGFLIVIGYISHSWFQILCKEWIPRTCTLIIQIMSTKSLKLTPILDNKIGKCF